MKEYNKPTQSQALFGLGFMEMIPLPRLGFLRVFLANHVASTDNLTRKTRQNTQQRKLTIHKRTPNKQQHNKKHAKI